MPSEDPYSHTLFPVLRLREQEQRAADHAPLCIGIPLPAGYCFDQRKLVLLDSAGREICACIEPSALWPDNSIQWCLVRAGISLAADARIEVGVGLRNGNACKAPSETTMVDDRASHLRVSTAGPEYRINTERLELFSLPEADISSAITLSYQGSELHAVVEDYAYRTLVSECGPLGANIELSGAFALPGGKSLRFQCVLAIARSGQRVDAQLRLHNPSAALHPQGLWDLGDDNSVLFDRLAVTLHWPEDPGRSHRGGRIQVDRSEPAASFSSEASITQHSSGGDNWDSPVHVDRNGQVPMSRRGYSLFIDGVEHRGERASPAVQVRTGSGSLCARIADFWEHFPGAITTQPGELTLELFPASGYAHEIQPGEQTTKRFSVVVDGADSSDRGEEPGSRFTDLVPALDSAHIRRCALPEVGDGATTDPRIQRLVDEGLSGEQSFFVKREMADEYGWRHFGEIYADHESDGYAGDRLFVSHYNNQYDPVFGFLRQYLLHEDTRWRQLAVDLARHTVDIDIYSTDEDRPEYNHGMFWHTDHYLPAETATHRAYSRNQPADAYEGHTRGGGPGGQHCYTTGLLYHHLLTGEEASRRAVLQLRQWIEVVYDGTGTLTDVLLAIRNRNRRDLKNHLTGQYPLDRGIANFINALLDCHILDRKHSTITQVEYIIRNTVHPAEDVSARDLKNVEDNWYYLVFLQALCRYLQYKRDADELDEAFCYARDVLLNYADWMVEHESPYLDRPEILEFPNHTWTAQDLRKANVLFLAAYWSADDGAAYRKKAESFVNYVAETLAAEPTRQYARILVLLLQNICPSTPIPTTGSRLPARRSYAPPRPPGLATQAGNLVRLVGRALWQFRPRREVQAIQRLLRSREARPPAS
jgi:hypothetical protein